MHRERNGTGRGRRIIILLLLSVIFLLAAISCVLALQLYRRSDPKLTGSWRMQVNLSEIARARANAWLGQAELGDQVDLADAMPMLFADVNLTLREDGSWSRSLDEDSYALAEKAANSALAESLRRLLCLRLKEAGRTAGTAEEAEKHIERAIGMSSERYLAEYGPALLPKPEELQSFYDGSGTWQVEGRHISFDGKTGMRYLADDSLLLLYGEGRTEVYARAK
jgi:hypothetical protein